MADNLLDLDTHIAKHAAPPPGPDVKVPVYLGDLAGQGGNAFWILGRVRGYFKDVGRSAEDYAAFDAEAKSGNYEHLLDTVLKWCDDLDGSIAYLRGRTHDGYSDYDEEED